MKKKWPFASPDYLLAKRICDLREEYGINILTPEERRLIQSQIDYLLFDMLGGILNFCVSLTFSILNMKKIQIPLLEPFQPL